MDITLTPIHIENIQTLEPFESSAFTYNPKIWRILKDEHKEIVRQYEYKNISRSQVLEVYQDYFNHSPRKDIKLTMLITMLWGFGENGYGAYRTEKYLTENSLELFREALHDLQLEEAENAFKKLMSINGMGISYVSKILYFASRALGISNYMLIFDIRVARSLVQLMNPTIAAILDIAPSSKWADYVKYNEIIHKTAKTYNIEADSLEMFLFDQKF